MKKIIFTTFAICAIVFASYAQEGLKEIAKPAALDNAKLDGFIDDSFAIYDQTKAIGTELESSDAAIADVEKKESPTAEEVKAIRDQLDGNKTKLQNLQANAEELAGKSDEVMGGAKTITPKTKSLKAIKNVKTSLNAVNAAKNQIPALLKKVADQEVRVEAVEVLNK